MSYHIPGVEALFEQIALNAWAASIPDESKRRLLINATYASQEFRREAIEAGQRLLDEQREAFERDWRYDDERDEYVLADPEDYCRRHCRERANGVHRMDCSFLEAHAS